ncbi:hypothetical protein HNY73_007384 [Argiope bruennichi]|uniref:Uncharacterized protein n=1 Tax=Argiope bruennichi TaxID=94029 RepID=A0A8T0FEC2_ARGBR|nr:hypothetical protein HNY73_007384 [Argiope bruennichi]
MTTMEKQPIFVLKLSLQEMALRRVVVKLWNEKEILTSIVNFRKEVTPDHESERAGRCCQEKEKDSKELQEMTENKVKNKVKNLVLPESLKKQMMLIIKPIGSQILRWKMSFRKRNAINCSDDWDIDILEQLCWTSTGTVDYGKTAENLVRLKTLDVVKRYKLASLYCLTDCIPVLWKELPEEYKKNFCNENGLSLKIEELLEFYWAYVAMKKEYELCSMVARRFGEGW